MPRGTKFIKHLAYCVDKYWKASGIIKLHWRTQWWCLIWFLWSSAPSVLDTPYIKQQGCATLQYNTLNNRDVLPYSTIHYTTGMCNLTVQYTKQQGCATLQYNTLNNRDVPPYSTIHYTKGMCHLTVQYTKQQGCATLQYNTLYNRDVWPYSTIH
jgi:hypothetical protein